MLSLGHEPLLEARCLPGIISRGGPSESRLCTDRHAQMSLTEGMAIGDAPGLRMSEERLTTMPARFKPYSESGAPSDPPESDAYIPVRVPDGPGRDGRLLVYLPDGTGVVVNSRQLLRLDSDTGGQAEFADDEGVSPLADRLVPRRET